MRTLAILLLKDWRCAMRRPAGWLVFLGIPMVITGLVGLIFAPRGNDSALGRIRFALVDEDDSILSKAMRGSTGQDEGSKYLDPVVMTREEALKAVRENQLSAAVIIPTNFTHNYLTTTNVVSIELVKNPAQSIHPAVLEELLGVVVTGLDAVKQNFGEELPDWQSVFEGKRDYLGIAELVVRDGGKLHAIRSALSPPRVSYEKAEEGDSPSAGPSKVSPATPRGSVEPKPAEANTAASSKPTPKKKETGPSFNIFAYILPGMASMFLLFLAENAGRSVQRELEHQTVSRYRTFRTRLHLFVASKVLFCVVFLFFCSGVMIGGGSVLFRIHWRHPFAMAALTAGYCLFAAGLMSLLPVMFRDQRNSRAFANVVAMILGLAGGSMFPSEGLPAFLRNYLTPALPNHWYILTARSLAADAVPHAWLSVTLGTALGGMVLALIAAIFLRRSLEQ